MRRAGIYAVVQGLLLLAGEDARGNAKQALVKKPVPQLSRASFHLRDQLACAPFTRVAHEPKNTP